MRRGSLISNRGSLTPCCVEVAQVPIPQEIMNAREKGIRRLNGGCWCPLIRRIQSTEESPSVNRRVEGSNPSRGMGVDRGPGGVPDRSVRVGALVEDEGRQQGLV